MQSYLGLAFGVNAGFQALAVPWAAAGSSLLGSPQVELYLAMSVFPIFMLPLLERWPTSHSITTSLAE